MASCTFMVSVPGFSCFCGVAIFARRFKPVDVSLSDDDLAVPMRSRASVYTLDIMLINSKR